MHSLVLTLYDLSTFKNLASKLHNIGFTNVKLIGVNLISSINDSIMRIALLSIR
jgi:hypothetical protein